MITRLDGASARKISAGQVITDLTSVVKELLENALDAQATTVTINLVRYGLETIAVTDNGTGIKLGPILDTNTGVLHAHYTTPLLSSRASTKHHDPVAQANNSDDAETQEEDGEEAAADPSLGFRGEALHSLAQMGDVTVSTRSSCTAPYTVCISYCAATHQSTLEVLQQREEDGTTVTVRNLFQHLPVRHREYSKNTRKQLSKATSTVKQYAVSHPRARLLMTHQELPNGALTTLVSLTGSGDVSRSLTEAYGGQCVSQMQWVDWTLSFGAVCGLVSKVDGGGRLSSDHQVFALDGRLVDLPRLAKSVNDAFAQCLPNASQRLHVAFFLHLKTNPSVLYDVNLIPNKRKVLLAQEERLAEELHYCALQEFSLASQSIELGRDARLAHAHAADVRATELTRLTRTPLSATSFTQYTFKKPKLEKDEEGEGRERGGRASDRVPALMELPQLSQFLYDNSKRDEEEEQPLRDDISTSRSSSYKANSQPEDSISSTSCSSSSDSSDTDGNDTGAKNQMEEKVPSSVKTEMTKADAEWQPEVTRLSDDGNRERVHGACYHCVSPSLKTLTESPLLPDPFTPTVERFMPTQKRPRTSTALNARTLGAQTESDLTQYFHKNSFKEMEVIGQFNHGFIIAVQRNGDVFIIDQHASDEKCNYERLMRDYTATPQPLVIPVPVAMDAHEVDLAIEHSTTLLQHGFKVLRGADDTKLLVSSIPVLPYDVVTASDVMELVQQLVQYDTITTPLRAVWHSMATKACRSSIMIGTALTMSTMKKILQRLGELDQPWNCPHGRPTLRLLSNINELRHTK